ncbi:hypothetical protein [Moraxella bovis]|uniref:Uncharacterized protein n=1 Tax=Moraxella bovis TaxID=476 RepID=A0AAX3ET48_MORBO|nr:hypothetical protein [Moraxella bovis]UYZ82152.1 hypothetical protein LP113_05450 [Moraxella bovis]UYZ91286.1 hypothetical protein LP103_08775 [Moraxella bovis]UYZ93734.1 hypothetical protein LP121_07370 [Moraxella bovis]UZA31070.1 hypothetical protein LP097_05555 [Moraxella bovis]UZA49549.1 hypothetical protein LP100_05140 [Moraxella bovis]
MQQSGGGRWWIGGFDERFTNKKGVPNDTPFYLCRLFHKWQHQEAL